MAHQKQEVVDQDSTLDDYYTECKQYLQIRN